MAIVKPRHIMNAYIAKDAADIARFAKKRKEPKNFDVRYKYVLNVVPIIEEAIFTACKNGNLSCHIDYECLLRNDDDIVNDKISPNLITEYLESNDYKVDIIHKPELSFYISWDI